MPSFVHAAAVAGSGRAETPAAPAQAEHYLEAHRYEEALDALGGVHVPTTSTPRPGPGCTSGGVE